MSRFDYVLVGGGLQSGLLALALRHRQPDTKLALIERDAQLGGDHTWCFHRSDVPPTSEDWLEPLVLHRWPGYRVVFPTFERVIDTPYAGTSSSRLHQRVSESVGAHVGSELLLGAVATKVEDHRVRLSCGEEVGGTVVIDARGPEKPADGAPGGYQKFLGQEVELDRPHGLCVPTLMDATVDQSHGYRFFYVLPLSDRRLLIEDTYFHDSPHLEREELRSEIHAYAALKGWTVASVGREETGVLPMPWAGTFEPPGLGPLRAGYRGGWFHPATGYSFPVALRLAEFVAGRPPTDLFGTDLARLARGHGVQVAFAQLLNRLLFRWYPPHVRHAAFERFYRLPTETIGNFYGLRLRTLDMARLLVGRPPPGLSLRFRLRSFQQTGGRP